MENKRIFGVLTREEWEKGDDVPSEKGTYEDYLKHCLEITLQLESTERVFQLEKGEAAKSIFDMNPAEIREVSQEIFQIVKIKAAEVGQLPVVS